MRCKECGTRFAIWQVMCPSCGMLRPNYVKKFALWAFGIIVFVVAVYELAHVAISVGSGEQ
jgi:uncharacterized OB-fold protein